MESKKLLIADDHITTQKIIRLVLSNDGYDIECVSNGEEALVQMSVFKPDVLLVDLSLPGKSAFELKELAQENDDLSHIQFILMSSAFEKVDEAKASLLGFRSRLTKPVDPGHLRTVLKSILASPSETIPARPPAAPGKLGGPPARPGSLSASPPPSIVPPRPPAAPNAISFSEDELTGEFSLQDRDFSDEAPRPILIEERTDLTLKADFAVDDGDISKLTESTLKISELDEWDISTPAMDTFSSGASHASTAVPSEQNSSSAAISPTLNSADIHETLDQLVQTFLEREVPRKLEAHFSSLSKEEFRAITEKIVREEIQKILARLEA